MKTKTFTINQIIIVFILSVIICKEEHDREESNDNDLQIQDSYVKDEINYEKNYNNSKIYFESKNINISNLDMENFEIESIDFDTPIDLTDDEMDMVLICVYISQYALKTKLKEDINIIAKNIGTSDTKTVYDKLGLEFSEKCIEYIEQETVNKYITNLTYHKNFVWENQFDNFTIIDYDKYKTLSDLKFTIEQQILLKFLHQSNEEFKKRKKEINKNKEIIYSNITINDNIGGEQEKQKESENIRPENNDNNKNEINNINENINNNQNNKKTIFLEHVFKKMKFLFYFVILLIVIGTIMYLLRKKDTTNKGKDKDKNKNTKKKKKKVV